MTKLTKEEFAARINGREYGRELTKDDEAIAKESRLVVVYGYSDDNVEMRGLVDDEIGACGGAEFRIVRTGKGWGVSEADHEWAKGFIVEAVWDPGEPACSWLIKTSIPHATFDVMEDGDLFCRGIVIAESDMLAVPNLTDEENRLVDAVLDSVGARK